MQNPTSPAYAPLPLPVSNESERALLGAMISDNTLCEEVVGLGVTRSAFYSTPNGIVFDAIFGILQHGFQADLVTLSNELSKYGKLEEVGGVSYLASLVDQVPGISVPHARGYAEGVMDTFRRRSAISAAQRFAVAASAGHANGELARLRTALDKADSALTRQSTDPQTLSELRAIAVEMSGTEKIPTGIAELDHTLQGGVCPGHFICIGAFSGQGKTTLCVHQATHKASLGHNTLYITAELSAVEVGAKAEMTFDNPFENVPNLKIWYADGDIQAIVKKTEAWIDTCPPSKLCPVVVVDYLQKLKSMDGVQSREREVAIVCEELQTLGRKRGVLLIVAAQLNRKSQEDKPQLHHLRESGLIEQVSDLAILIAKTGDESMWMLVAKNRWGTSGKEIEVAADYPHCRFANLTPQQRYGELAKSIVAYLSSEETRKAKVRDISIGVRFGKEHPNKAEIEAAAAACGGFNVFGSEVALIGVREA